MEGEGGWDVDEKLKGKWLGLCVMLLVKRGDGDTGRRALVLTHLSHQPDSSSS